MLRGMLLPRTLVALIRMRVPQIRGRWSRRRLLAALALAAVAGSVAWFLLAGYSLGPRLTVQEQVMGPPLAEPVPLETPAGSATAPRETADHAPDAAGASYQASGSGSTTTEAKATGGAQKVGEAAPAGLSRLSWPVEGEVARNYGYGFVPAYGDYRFHPGLDLTAPSGTPVVAAADGQIKEVAYDESHRWQVVLTHGAGWETVYLELARVEDLAAGSWVRAGTKLGHLGEPGRGAETPIPHLHFELRHQGEARNPLEFLR